MRHLPDQLPISYEVPMKKILIFVVLNLVLILPALAMNCKELWIKGYPDERFPEGLECTFSKKIEMWGFEANVYHYAASFPRAPEDTGFSFIAQEVFTDFLKAAKRFNTESSTRLNIKNVTFILTDHKAEGTEIAKVRIGHANEDENEPCPVVVYKDSLKLFSPQVQKQLIAHELFHCVQDTLWREKALGPTKRAREWWTEGSAVWFSNYVYPDANQEYVYNNTYEGHSPLVLQQEGFSYASYLFFQSLSHEWMGVDGVIGLIRSLPDSGGTGEQMKAVVDYSSMNLIFNSFAKDLTSMQIKDFNSSFIPSHMLDTAENVDVKIGSHVEEWYNEILTIKVKELRLPPKSIVTIDIDPDDDGNNPMSFRGTAGTGLWNDMYKGYPTTIDMSCKAVPRFAEVLSSYAGTDPLNEKFRLKIKAEKADCQCEDKVEFDKCLFGDYALDKASLDKIFSRIFRFRTYEVENSHGEYLLNVAAGQKFTFKEKEFSASVIIKDETYGDIRVFVKVTGSTDALGKLVSKNELCFSDIGNDYQIYQRIEMPYGTVENTMPYSQFEDFTRGPVGYSCKGNELIFKWKLPTGAEGENEEHQLRFVRQ